MNSAHVTEDIPAYALGILEETERAAVSLHLESCPACKDELRSYQAVVDQLPLAVPQSTPPTRLRAGILQAAVVQAEASRMKRPSLLAWFARPLNPLVGLVGLVLIVILAAFNIYQWQQARQAPGQSYTFSDFHLVAMQPPESVGKNASGVLLINKQGTLGTLVVNGLTTLDPAQQYQLWLIKRWSSHQRGRFFGVWERLRLSIYPFPPAVGQLHIVRGYHRAQRRQPWSNR